MTTPKPTPGPFGARLARVRKRLKMSRRDMATALGTSFWNIKNWERGISEPRFDYSGELKRLEGGK